MRGAALRQALDIRSPAWRWQGASVHRRPCERREPYAAADFLGTLIDVFQTTAPRGYGSLRSQGRRLLYRRLAVPHRRPDGQAFGRIDDGVGVNAVVAGAGAHTGGL